MAAPYRRLRMVAGVAMTLAIAGACSNSSATNTPAAATQQPGSNATQAPAATQSHKAVTISVGALPPGATHEAVDALNLQINQFETKYPWVTVTPEEYNWQADTFTAQLLAGTLPTVFTI